MIPGGPGCHGIVPVAAAQGGGGGGILPIPFGGAIIDGGGGMSGLGGVICDGSNMEMVFLRGGAAPIPPLFNRKSGVAGGGGGPSPNSAISDIYSSSILALSPPAPTVAPGPPKPGRF